ncbi:MAG: hypothetical protein HYZ93_00035 [Candidatus Omnitrophica bacterium]|nr:hypothetical protein [Candidatus Omnitrophota bacterium]
MKRYQLLWPRERSLYEMLDDVTWAVWKGMVQQPEFAHLNSYAFDLLQQTVRKIFGPHLFVSDLCGLGAECEEGTSPGPWMEPNHPVLAKETVGWYLLEVERDLGQLVKELSDGLSCTLMELTGGTMIPTPLEPSVEQALKESVGQYLYENVSCGETLLCRDALRVSPWRE